MAGPTISIEKVSTLLKVAAVTLIIIFIVSFVTQGAGESTNKAEVSVFSKVGKVGVIEIEYPTALQQVETGKIKIKLLPSEENAQQKYSFELKFKDFDFKSVDPNPPLFKLTLQDSSSQIYYVKLKHEKATNVAQRLPFGLHNKSSPDLKIGEGNEITIVAVEKTDLFGISEEIRSWIGAFGGGTAILSLLLGSYSIRDKKSALGTPN